MELIGHLDPDRVNIIAIDCGLAPPKIAEEIIKKQSGILRKSLDEWGMQNTRFVMMRKDHY